jgi:hypothetical protein
MYVNHATGQQIDCPDPEAGLYIVDRHDVTHRIQIPPDCMAIQMGECTQIVTGGTVTATPHCVRGTMQPGIARISLPCFVDTPPNFPLSMPMNCTRRQVLADSSSSGSSQSSGQRVPPLDQRWTRDGMTFGDFLQATFAMYYDWSEPKE